MDMNTNKQISNTIEYFSMFYIPKMRGAIKRKYGRYYSTVSVLESQYSSLE